MKLVHDTGPQVSRFRPINFMHEVGVDPMHVETVLSATRAVLRTAGVEDRIELRNFGAWRNCHWRNGDRYLNWQSVDWYLRVAFDFSRNETQFHGGKLMELLWNEPWQEAEPHYDIVLTKSDMYDVDCNFVIGLAVQGFGTVISTNRFLGLPAAEARECIITETMHEVGHVFGLVPGDRTDNVEESLGKHCANRCIMRQGLVVPRDWQVFTQDRLAGNGFCPTCMRDLRKYFCD
jgi:predicted Zn-dependent protease